MKKLTLLLTAIVSLALSASAADKKAGKWISLFDGKKIEGFEPKGGTATYRVEDGAIVGKTKEGS
ncbi:MAG: DUF1080 domain-containing protein, partial [Verrucomicrobiia bacterium]